MPIKYLLSVLLLLCLVVFQPFAYGEEGDQNTNSGTVVTGSGITSSGSTNTLLQTDNSIPQIQSFNSFQALSKPSIGLLGDWDLNGNALDSSGNSNNGLADNIVYTSTLGENQVGNFNGNNSVIELPIGLFNSDLQGANAASLQFGVKRESISVGDETELIYSNHGLATIQVDINPDDTLRLGGRSQVSDTYQKASSDVKLNQIGKWYHVIATFDYENSRLIAYIDGVEAINSNVNFGSRIFDIDTVGYINIGEFNGNRFFDGDMGLIKIWDTVLTQSEIEDLYKEGEEKILGVLPIPIPTNLTQSFIAPETEPEDIQPIDIGQSIGKFQSGSGIILRADIESDTPMDYSLRVEVYPVGSTLPLTFGDSTFKISGSGEVLISDLSAGEYYWTAQVVDNNNTDNFSSVVQFGENIFLNTDFAIFEGFEPYPFGYSFNNRTLSNGTLSGGVSFGSIDSFPYYGSIFTPGNRWDLFNNTFDTSNGSGLEPGTVKALLAFSAIGLNSDNPFVGGSCYGMSASALSEYTNRNLFSSLSDEPIWSSINSPSTTLNGDWDIYNNTLENIFKYQLLQFSSHARKANIDGEDSPENIAQTILDNPNEKYILSFQGETFSEKLIGHAVVPYKVEGNRIYFWDNNVPFPNITRLNGDILNGYEQYLELLPDGNVEFSSYNWKSYDKFSLININDIYNNGEKSIPFGFTSSDYLYIFHGDVDFQITDINENVLSYKEGNLIEEIEGAELFIPLNANLEGIDYNNDLKMVYFSKGIDDFDIEIIAKGVGNYDITAVGGDYYSEILGVDTHSGGVDTYKFSRDRLELDFSDTLEGSYDLLYVDFTNTGSGIININDVWNTGNEQQYTFDWEKIHGDQENSYTYEVEGLVDESTYIYPNSTISWNSGQQRSISSYYSIVPNFDEYNWGQDITFTTSGDGNPTIQTTQNGRQPNGVLQSGANIQMDVPPAGESYTAYLHIGEHTLEYTVTRDAPPSSDVGTLDFGTKTVNYSGTAVSNWVNFPFLPKDTAFTLTGEGNPTAQTVDGQLSDTGFVRWGTNITAEIPEPGKTRTIEFEILGQTGIFTIIRQ